MNLPPGVEQLDPHSSDDMKRLAELLGSQLCTIAAPLVAHMPPQVAAAFWATLLMAPAGAMGASIGMDTSRTVLKIVEAMLEKVIASTPQLQSHRSH